MLGIFLFAPTFRYRNDSIDNIIKIGDQIVAAVLKPTPQRSATTLYSSSLGEKFASRKSDELIIAFAGPLGCGITSVIEEMTERLKDRGYVDVVHIKLSNFLETAITTGLVPAWVPPGEVSSRFKRYRRLQDSGKELRKRTRNPAILAEFAAQEIAVDRQRRDQEHAQPAQDGAAIIPGRVAYLIDQVKRPEEVALLRTLYRNLFFLAGVTRIYDKRVSALAGELVRVDEIPGLMQIDRLEGGEDGQQLDKTLHLADYFIRNDATTVEEKKHKLNRFLDLIHGDKSVTPTYPEDGMYAAYCASLRSACLSRQVGASIATQTGEVIATGCNDVPKSGGGLYNSSSPITDMRCVNREGQLCSNDLHKRQLQGEIGVIIDRALSEASSGPIELPQADRILLLDSIYKNTRLKDLIEFSRSVHAEMDAIVSLARLGGSGLHGATLYTTTFPCHSCARHIVAAGISRVFYIEPYEKSLAKELHSDSIAFEIEESSETHPRRVEFLHFEGVAPRQFHNMFRATGRKDSSGKYVPIKVREADKLLPEYLDNYQDFEKKAVQHLNEAIEKLSQQNSIDIGPSVREDHGHLVKKEP
jgi:deoxycytidylate deaminase